MKRFYIGLLAGLLIGLLLATTTFAVAAQPIKLIVNGVDITPKCDVPPQIIDGRTLVPARFLAEALGATVKWDHENRAVVVTLIDNASFNEKISENNTGKFETSHNVSVPVNYWGTKESLEINIKGIEYGNTSWHYDTGNDLLISYNLFSTILWSKDMDLKQKDDKFEIYRKSNSEKRFDGTPIATINRYVYHQNGPFILVSIKEINKTGLLSLEWDSITRTLYVNE